MKNKRVLLIVPSLVVAKGLETILGEAGGFEVCGIMSDLSSTAAVRLRNMDVDVVVFDPMVLDYGTRSRCRALISEYTDAAVVGFGSSQLDDDLVRQFDEIIGIYDEPAVIARKLRSSQESHSDAPKPEGEELSSREKEILVCVASGMLNKEIADKFFISIHTVITHRKNITRKTGIKTVAGLTVYALLNNLIDVNTFE